MISTSLCSSGDLSIFFPLVFYLFVADFPFLRLIEICELSVLLLSDVMFCCVLRPWDTFKDDCFVLSCSACSCCFNNELQHFSIQSLNIFSSSFSTLHATYCLMLLSIKSKAPLKMPEIAFFLSKSNYSIFLCQQFWTNSLTEYSSWILYTLSFRWDSSKSNVLLASLIYKISLHSCCSRSSCMD